MDLGMNAVRFVVLIGWNFLFIWSTGLGIEHCHNQNTFTKIKIFTLWLMLILFPKHGEKIIYPFLNVQVWETVRTFLMSDFSLIIFKSLNWLVTGAVDFFPFVFMRTKSLWLPHQNWNGLWFYLWSRFNQLEKLRRRRKTNRREWNHTAHHTFVEIWAAANQRKKNS